MIAKNRENYVEAWRAHVGQLCNLFIDSDREFGAWKETEKALEAVIESAADRCFPDPVAMSSELPSQEAVTT